MCITGPFPFLQNDTGSQVKMRLARNVDLRNRLSGSFGILYCFKGIDAPIAVQCAVPLIVVAAALCVNFITRIFEQIFNLTDR